MSELAAWVEISKQYDIDTRLIDGDELLPYRDSVDH
jgi:hypothetical protein